MHRALDRSFGQYGLTEAAIAEEFGLSLYESQPDYLKQISAYKQFQGKEKVVSADEIEEVGEAEEESEDKEL